MRDLATQQFNQDPIPTNEICVLGRGNPAEGLVLSTSAGILFVLALIVWGPMIVDWITRIVYWTD